MKVWQVKQVLATEKISQLLVWMLLIDWHLYQQIKHFFNSVQLHKTLMLLN